MTFFSIWVIPAIFNVFPSLLDAATQKCQSEQCDLSSFLQVGNLKEQLEKSDAQLEEGDEEGEEEDEEDWLNFDQQEDEEDLSDLGDEQDLQPRPKKIKFEVLSGPCFTINDRGRRCVASPGYDKDWKKEPPYYDNNVKCEIKMSLENGRPSGSCLMPKWFELVPGDNVCLNGNKRCFTGGEGPPYADSPFQEGTNWPQIPRKGFSVFNFTSTSTGHPHPLGTGFMICSWPCGHRGRHTRGDGCHTRGRKDREAQCKAGQRENGWWCAGDPVPTEPPKIQPTQPPKPTEAPTPEPPKSGNPSLRAKMPCKSWCAKKTNKPWSKKCGWTKCAGCSSCSGMPLCLNWCSKNGRSWSKKCKKQICKECDQCK
mmetsp:Transcript_77013/g.133271  ORF Transcript_77013/g.133271 Transcript_77013/m.133271 type:complete len:369 (-) Transcript_77013:342-1448(-)